MAIRNIRKDQDPILRKISKPVDRITERTDELINDMISDLHDYEGVGLAAVQVGVLKRICVICIEDFMGAEESENGSDENEDNKKPKDFPGFEDYVDHTNGENIVIINPEVIVDSDVIQKGNEGCLSFPGRYGCVTRPYYVTLKAFDRNMQPFEIKAKGLLARAICHECEHMDGKLFVDKVEGELFTPGEEE